MMKKSFYAQQSNAHKSQRAEHAATKAFSAKQDAASHHGRKMTPITGNTLKKQERGATGGYLGGNPFKGLK